MSDTITGSVGSSVGASADPSLDPPVDRPSSTTLRDLVAPPTPAGALGPVVIDVVLDAPEAGNLLADAPSAPALAVPSPTWRERRTRTWLTTSGRALAVRVDEPEGRRAVGALVVVPSFGREATVSFRTTRALAAHAAAAGFVAYSFDLSGDGDSEDLRKDDNPARCWVRDVEAVIALARGAVGDDAPVHVVGLRLGAAILAATPRTGPGNRVYWEPVSGRMFLRAHRLIRTQAIGVPPLTSGVELDGTYVSDAQAAGIATLRTPPRPADGAGDDGAGDRVLVDDDRQAGLRIALGAPFFATVPLATIRGIVAGLPAATPRALPGWAGVDEVTLTAPDGTEVVERWCTVGPRRLLAVRTHAPGAPVRAGLVATAIGAEVRSGPGGVWARAARELAGAGVVTLRADRALLGDDAEPTSSEEPRPYTDAAVRSLAEAVDHLRAQDDAVPIVGIGICAGAWGLLRAARSCRLDEVIAINPVHFNPDTAVYDEAFYRHYHGEEAPALSVGQPAPPATAAHGRRVINRAWDFKHAVSHKLAVRYPRLRAAVRRDVPVDDVRDLVRLVPARTCVRFIFGAEEHRIFVGKGGRKAMARFARSGGRGAVEVDPLVDHSLLAETARARVLQLLRRSVVDAPPATAGR